MAAANEATGATDRRVLLGALLALGFVTGVAFGRAFSGTTPSIVLGLTGAVSIVVAALLAHRHLGLSLLAGAGALALLMAWFVFPRTTWYGVPTDDTFRALLTALGRSTDRVATEVAPAPTLDALMAPAMVAVWAATTSAHALAARSLSTVLPLLPCAALLAFAGVLAKDGSRPAYVVFFLAASLAVIYGGSLIRLRSWGPAVGATSRWGRAGGLGRWARRLGLAAVAGALILPGLLPGFDSRSIIRVNGGSARVAVNPFVDIRPNLLQNPPAHLFTVRSERAAYWRMLSLDRFDGRLWSSSDPRGTVATSVVDGSLLGGPRPGPPAPALLQEFEVEELSVPWLPAAYRPTSAAAGPARWNGAEATLFTDGETEDGFRYEVTSRIPLASPVELDRIDPSTSETPALYTALPGSVPSRIHDLARNLSGGEPTPFRRLLAIQEHLRGFQYDERAPAGHGVNDILYFLEQSKRGYCEQFAGTMAVLARSLGYPARVAVGFLPGDPTGDDSFRVTSEHVHAWTEVFFGDYGWLAFEPTPTRENPVAGYLTPPPAGPRPDANLGAGIQGAGTEDPRSSRGAAQRDAQDLSRRPGLPGLVSARRPTERPSAVRSLLPWAIAALAFVLLLVPPAKLVARHLALGRRGSSRHGVVSAYAVVLWVAQDLGLGRRRGETPWEYRTRIRSEVALSNGHLERLTGLAGRALYAEGGLGQAEGEDAGRAARALLRDLRRHAGPVRTVAGAFRPSLPR
jgi:transglutaminase-like putative cysteine protease